jgi:hypothetical protein
VVSFTPRPVYPRHARAGLDAVKKRKILHCRESNPGLPFRNTSLQRLVSELLRDYTMSHFGTWYCVRTQHQYIGVSVRRNSYGARHSVLCSLRLSRKSDFWSASISCARQVAYTAGECRAGLARREALLSCGACPLPVMITEAWQIRISFVASNDTLICVLAHFPDTGLCNFHVICAPPPPPY